MKIKFWGLLFLLVAVGGCAVYTDRIAGTYRPSLSTDYTGILAVEFGGGLGDATPYMFNLCRDYGGLNQSSVVEVASPMGLMGVGHTFWKYRCNGLSARFEQRSPIQQYAAPPQPNLNKNPGQSGLSPQQARERCKELGFKDGSDALADCALKLLR